MIFNFVLRIMAWWNPSSSSSGNETGSGSNGSFRGYGRAPSPGYFSNSTGSNGSNSTATWGESGSDRFGNNTGSSASWGLSTQDSSVSGRTLNRLFNSASSESRSSQSSQGWRSDSSGRSGRSNSSSNSSSSSNGSVTFRPGYPDPRTAYGPALDGTYGNPSDPNSNEPRPMSKFGFILLLRICLIY